MITSVTHWLHSKKSAVILLLVILVFSGVKKSCAQLTTPVETELKDERGMYTKIFQKENGAKVAVFSSQPVHYSNHGQWDDIHTGLTRTNEGYINKTNVIQSEFPFRTGKTENVRLVMNGMDEIIIHSEKKWVHINDASGIPEMAGTSGNLIAIVNENRIMYTDSAESISDEYTILNGGIKNNVILQRFPSIASSFTTGYVGFMESLVLPDGWKIIYDNPALNGPVASSLSVLDDNGNTVLTIPAPVFSDNHGSVSDGTHPVTGKYLVRQNGTHCTLCTLVPVDWLKDKNTHYPVSLDPTIVIAGTTGGWQSPNNFVDNPAFVFIGVCCSNLTHRAWIKFNTTAIPDADCVTSVELQVNVITVVAATPELVHINDVTGAFGPYGAINAAAYTDFGNGYYNSFTINGTGLYGYYSLGASACAVLQSQLGVNWFQVALMLDNEPSTNYKIMSGTTSNLRVTYTGCVLPVELLSFDANCGNGQIDFSWSTASQMNNDFFTLERSTDGVNFDKVGITPGGGNKNTLQYFTQHDFYPPDGLVYYRLSQTDNNGHSEILKSVAVNCDYNDDPWLYPNPATGIFSIDKAAEGSTVMVTDVYGQIVFQKIMNTAQTNIDLSSHPEGVYFVQILSGNEAVAKKIILQR